MTASLERPVAATTATATATATGWTTVCAFDDLLPERGVAALVDGVQVAVFRLFDGSLHAIGHRDPFSGAHVLARGLVGTRSDAPTVASPMYKQVFDLRTGQCLDDPAVSVPVYPVRRREDLVEVAVA
ncbi:nitrite reductase small subunit NirD [Modestobacter sp. SYSU DS0657]